jgi:hypothetical protein
LYKGSSLIGISTNVKLSGASRISAFAKARLMDSADRLPTT